MLRVIREQEPSKPSTKLSTSERLPTLAANRGTEPAKLTKLVRGELDWIVMKCLEKDRSRRYETANGFAMDLQRYLADEPVLACPPSNWYRFRKFARKNRNLLTAAGTVAALAVLTTVAAVWAAVQSARLADLEHGLRDTAERKAEEERKAKQEVEWNLYVHAVARAQQELLAGNRGRAHELLEDCPVLLRGWEWHHLKRHEPGNPLILPGYFAAAFSPDGRYLVVPTEAEMSVVDPVTGKQLRALGRTPGFVERWGLAFSPVAEELVLAIGPYNGTVVRLWDFNTAREIRTLGGHGDRIRTVTFSPDGQRLAVGDIARGARIWDWRTGRLLFELRRPPGISRIVFSPDSRRVAVAFWRKDNMISIRDAESGRELRTFGRHSGGIEALAYSPDGERVLSGGDDGTAKVWDERSGELRLTLAGHAGQIQDVAYTPDGRRIATAGWDKTIRIWHSETGKETLTLRGQSDEIQRVVFSPDGHRLVSTWRGQVRIWDATPVGEITGPEAFRVPGHASFVTGVAFSPDGRLLASAGADRSVQVWEVASLGRGIEPRGLTVQRYPDRVLGLAFSPDSRRLAYTGWDGGIKVWDTAGAREVWTSPSSAKATRVAFSPDGRRLASLDSMNLVFWNAETGERLATLPMHSGGLGGFAYSPDAKHVAVGNERFVFVCDLESGKELRALRHAKAVGGVAYRCDGRRLASASFDETVKVWDPINGQEVRTLRGHTDRVLSVAYSPDGKLLASGSADSTVRVWEEATGHEVATFRGHSGYVLSVAFSPDGKRLASGGGHHARGEVKVWDLQHLVLADTPAGEVDKKGPGQTPK
jgi:WD40 repeat protein